MFPRKIYSLPLPGRPTLELGRRTLVMGILNVTPDSFSDGGCYADPDRALDGALMMQADGADLIDVGGESTRPGAKRISAAEELARVLPVIQRMAPQLRVPISIDTSKAAVARAALDAGATLVNDVSALRYDPDLAAVVGAAGVPLVLMHARGSPLDMQSHASYDNVIAAVACELEEAIERAVTGGVPRDRLLLDPGLGFAKRPQHSYAALAHLEALAGLDRPLLVGPSRKSFLREALGDGAPAARDWGTAAAVTAAVLAGAHIVRVHAVGAMVQVVRVADRLRDARRAR